MSARSERLEARVPSDLKALFLRAAALRGQSLTDFVLAAAIDSARKVIRESEIIELSDRDQLAFAEALLDPPGPTPTLAAAAQRYLDETP